MLEIKKVKSRINWICDQKINAFSPTISPAPKNWDRKEIESIYEGVQYFVKNGVYEFIFQKKYMGSYCDIYLKKNIEESYFVSRNGHKITHINLQEAIEACKELYARFDWSNLSMLIIQAELLPWHVLGKGLIDREFQGYINAHQNHFEFLKHSSLYNKVEEIKSSEPYIEFLKQKENLSEVEYKKNIPPHIYRQYSAIENFQVFDLNKYAIGIKTYNTQINHFGKEQTLHFKPFNILKKIYDDGSEEIPNDNFTYSQVNDDEYLTLKINTELDLENQLIEVYKWYEKLSIHLDEGIMIKPKQAFIKGLPPAFKVRNNEYLTMIYGINFLDDYNYYMEKRNVAKKIKCSLNDWMINWELLKTKNIDINTENYHYKNLLLDRILGEELESTLDHRL